MSEAGVTAGAAAQATELRKHEANDVKCSELGWLCIPLVVESYGAWGKEAMESFSSLASRLAITSSRPKSAVLSELYGRLNLNLVRANMRAIMALKITSEVLCSFGHVFVCFVCPIIVSCIINKNNKYKQKSTGHNTVISQRYGDVQVVDEAELLQQPIASRCHDSLLSCSAVPQMIQLRCCIS